MRLPIPLNVTVALGILILSVGFLSADTAKQRNDKDKFSIESAQLVIYCGRSKSLVSPLIRLFEKQTGIKTKVNYAKTAQLAMVLQEEAGRGQADLFWAQDAGALSAVAKAKLLRRLPEKITARPAPPYRNRSSYWVATSGRARILAYARSRVGDTQLPTSIFNLVDEKWKNRVGWAPTNASFLSFVTAMRKMHGQGKTLAWLAAMKDNGAKRYAKNTPIIKALADGEIDLGLANHYYLLRFLKSDKKFPVGQIFFKHGDIGNLVNVAGIGIVRSGDNPLAAQRFVEFLLSLQAQQYFTSEVFEYPVTDGVILNKHLTNAGELAQILPRVNLDDLDDLKGTLSLLKKVGLR